jgi:predicted PhzF superfamily epimerase YddE/YHI9
MRIFQVDAFTSTALGGNPAAVVLLTTPAEPAWMQAVAAEMNLSETAFVEPVGGRYHVRWFTPATEVALCGHATLASAHVLYETGLAGADETITFDSLSGPLTACAAATAEAAATATGGAPAGLEIVLDFPARPAVSAPPPDGLLAALGVAGPAWTGVGEDDYLVVVGREEEVLNLRPDLTALARLSARGVIVTSPASRPDADFVSRFFAPAVGIPEDPVTGSAHCTLAPYWADRIGRSELTGFQASARGGTVKVSLDGDRVRLAGRAVTVLTGQLSDAALPKAQRPTA